MATESRNLGKSAIAEIERNKGAEQKIQKGTPAFSIDSQTEGSTAQKSTALNDIVDKYVSETSDNAVDQQPSTTSRPIENSNAASTAVSSQLGQQAATMSQQQQAAVPNTPQDSGLTPGIRASRVTTQVGGDAPQIDSDIQFESSELSDSGYTQPSEEQSSQPTLNTQSAAMTPEKAEAAMQREREEMQRYRNDAYQSAIQEAGFSEPPKKSNVFSRANRRFKEAKKNMQEKISNQLVGRRLYGSHGNAFNDTIISLSTLMPHQVSIGSGNLLEAIRDPNSNLLDIVNNANPTANLDLESCIMDINLLVNAINECGIKEGTKEIEVVFGKYPVNTKHSIQVRSLRAHRGRGIGLHPTQTKAYNADFDGDTGNLNFDQANLSKYSRAMSHMIDSEGKASIDPDFFPLDGLALYNTKDRQDLLKSMRERNFSWEPSVANRIIDAYIDACNNSDDKTTWVRLLRKIDEIAGDRDLQNQTGLYRNQLASRILKNVYDYAIDRRGLNLRMEWANVMDSYEYSEPDPDSDPIILSLIDMVEEIAQGHPAPNFQDFTDFFNKQYGDLNGESLNGKNVPFRLLADFAKAIKRTDLITVGDSVWGIDAKGNKDENSSTTMYDLWQFTCSAGVSKLISGRMYMGSRELAVSTHVKDFVRRKIPVPRWWKAGDVYEGKVVTEEQAVEWNKVNFRAWIKNFQELYNSQIRMLNVSQVSFRGGMRIYRKDKGKNKSLLRYDGFEDIGDCAKALIEVYGDLTVDRVFPDTVLSYGRKGAGNRENTNNGVINRYGHLSIAEFANTNRLDWYSEHVNKKNVSKIEMIKRRIEKDSFEPMDILMLVADRRSEQFGDYGKNWLEATEKQADIMKRIKGDIKNHDFNDYANDMLEFIHLMSPKMFDHFGMDSPATFARSKWGKKLANCETANEFRSVLISMTVEYRWSRASSLLKQKTELLEDVFPYVNRGERIAEINAHYLQEVRQLASSSLAWESIVSEAVGDTNAFQFLLENKKIKVRNHEYKMHAADFWNSNSLQTQYSLLNFLKSSADYDTKINVLCDVIKKNTGIDEGIDPSHIMGMLAHNPDPLFAGSRFEMDSGISSATRSVKDSIDKITSYKSKSPAKIKKQADKILEKAYEDKYAFEKMLYRFATEPDYYIHVDTVFAADAISSIYEKAYSDSEKIKQQTLVNGYFECLSYQRCGGFYTHLQQTDNGVVNTVGFDQLTNFDIVRILGDPSIELHGYDEFGTPCVYSRKALCGGNSIDDVLRYLHDHPRVALACRRHIVGINGDVDGTARLSVLDDEKAGVSHSNKVFSLLNDRPRFLAIAALITPTQGNVGRNLAELVNDNIRTLSLFVMNEAASDKGIEEIIQDIEKTFGITPEKFMQLRMQDSFDPDDTSEIDYEAVYGLYPSIVTELLDCIEVVQKSGISLVKVPDSMLKDKNNLIDKSSMMAYYDARQQLNGARTAKMIGIEGAETKKNLVLKEYVRNRPDRFMTVTEDFSRAEILALEEATQSNIREKLEDSGEPGKRFIVIEIPDGWNEGDLTTEHDPRKQISSIAKFLEVKREKGAETFNAKSKKYGDDGSNSIIKFFKYGTERMLGRYNKSKTDKLWTIEDGMQLREAIENAGSKDAAIPILAEALVRADERLGYIDIDKVFQRSDYYNRADLMLTEYKDTNENVKIAIRTLEQLAVAFRNRLSDEAVVSGNAETVLNELIQLEQVIGTPADPMYDSRSNESNLDRVRVISGIGNVTQLDRALRPYSSSNERNFFLIFDLFREFGKDEFNQNLYIMDSREEINKRSDKMFARLKNDDVREALKGVAYPNDRWVPARQEGNRWIKGHYELDPKGDRDEIYDYLGRPTDEGFKLIPGPQSLVYFEKEDMDTLEKCKKYGITAAFSDLNSIPSKYVKDAILLQGGIAILPFFDMRLNGSMSEPISAAPGQFFYNYNNVIISDEDTTFEAKPGDAVGFVTKEGMEKTYINYEGDILVNAFDLFPNVLREKIEEGETISSDQYIDFSSDDEFTLELASIEEVAAQLLSNPELINSSYVDENGDTVYGPTVDYGVLEGMPGFKREQDRFFIRLQEYIDRFNSGGVDDNSFITDEDCHYDSIVGFVKIKINADTYAFAPIIPFHFEQGGKRPDKFKITSTPVIEDENSSYHIRWKFTGDIRDQYIKFFEGIGASNKLMIQTEPIRSRTLANGLPIDIMYSTSSVASRLFPVNKRIHTMITMFMIPRLDHNYSYNFGKNDGAFPGNPTFSRYNEQTEQYDQIYVKDALIAGTITISEWRDIVSDNPELQYHNDPEINSVVKWFVEKCVHPETGYQTVNPNIFLATHVIRDGVKKYMQPVGTEYEAFMDSGYNFQNAFMHFMNEMNPTLVPANIDDDSTNTLFKPVNKGRHDNDYGVLQMMVPHWTPEDTEPYAVAENVYISFGFFGDEFSGFKKVNFNAANRGLDDLNVASSLDGFDLSQVMAFARAGYSSVPSMNMMEVASDNIMKDVDTEEEDSNEPITSFRGKYSFLSNMYDAHIIYSHTDFDNAEAAFQAQKLAYRKDSSGYSSLEMEAFSHLSGKEARERGRNMQINVRQWNENRDRIMKNILIDKFSNNSDLEAKLLSTGDRELIEENSWGDTYWGVSNGTGENKLGKILMEIRDELKKYQ